MIQGIKIWLVGIGFAGLVFSKASDALSDGAVAGGVGLYSLNSFYKTTKTDAGETSLFGANFYPLTLRFDWNVSEGWFFAPGILYTPLTVDGSDDTKTSFLVLNLPVGQNFATSWEWTAGIAFMRYSVKGPGGTKELNNGTSTSTFARPSRTEVATIGMWTGGIGYLSGPWRFGTDLTVSAPLSERRAFSLFFNISYAFLGGGQF